VLDRMGLRAEVTRQGCIVSGYEVVAPNGRTTAASVPADPGALVIRRYVLDDLILRRATASGANFQAEVTADHVEATSDRVLVVADGGRTYCGRLAIMATGAASRALTRSRILRRTPHAMLAARAYFESLRQPIAQTFQLRFDQVPQPGYGWIFPVAPSAANVGVGFLPQARRGTSGTARHAFERFVVGTGVQPILAGGRQAGPIKGYPIRVDFRRAPTVAERTLLVGEAAGLVNPLTGEGIDYALESGEIAARFIDSSLERTTGSLVELLAYDRLLRAQFDRVFRFSEVVRDWYCKPALLNLLVPLANRRPELRQMLANIVLGEREPRGYGPITMIARLLVYLAVARTREMTR
jgi:flavin-dependent dehydrogenase